MNNQEEDQHEEDDYTEKARIMGGCTGRGIVGGCTGKGDRSRTTMKIIKNLLLHLV